MSEQLRTRLLKYGLCSAVGLVFVAAYLSGNNVMVQKLVDQYKMLCDAFFVPGALMLLSGLLITLTNEGSLDAITYLGGKAVSMLLPGARAKRNREETYTDYLERRNDKRVKGYGFLYIVGAVFFIVSMIFLALFYQVYE